MSSSRNSLWWCFSGDLKTVAPIQSRSSRFLWFSPSLTNFMWQAHWHWSPLHAAVTFFNCGFVAIPDDGNKCFFLLIALVVVVDGIARSFHLPWTILLSDGCVILGFNCRLQLWFYWGKWFLRVIIAPNLQKDLWLCIQIFCWKLKNHYHPFFC